MQLIRNSKKDILTAVVLGLCALATNLASFHLLPNLLVNVGNILVYAAAGALGAWGALIAAVLVALPQTIIFGNPWAALRLAILAVSIGALSERMPRVPSFFVGLASWVFIFGPAAWFGSRYGITWSDTTITQLVVSGSGDIFLTVLSGSLLLNQDVWSSLTSRARLVDLQTLLVHAVTVVTSSAVAILFTISSIRSWYFNPLFSADHGLLLFSLAAGALVVPALAGFFLADLISGNSQELLNSFAHPSRSKSFSGLSSDYWRRQKPPGSDLDTSQNLESGKQKRGIINPSHGICALNRNGTIGFVNGVLRDLLGIKSNDIIGRNIDAIGLPLELVVPLLKLVEDTFTFGPATVEIKVNQLPDKLRFFQATSQRSDAFEDSSMADGPDSVILSIQDITDRRTIEAHLLQAQKLGSLGSAIGQIAHSFNNSLTAIAGQASYARHSADRVRTEVALDEILRSTRDAGDLVKNLLEFAEGRPSLMQPEILGKVIDERLTLLRKLVGEAYEIEFEHTPAQLWVECDTNLITQILSNLVLNARDSYTGESGKIDVSLDTEEMDDAVSKFHVGARAGTFARLRIRDHGHGMSPETLSKAFDPLYTTKAASGHSGLGLSIVFALVRAHNGFLTVESYPEKGTTVSVYLPITEHVEHATLNGKSRAVKSGGINLSDNSELANSRILVVEDEPRVRELVATMLSTLGYRVTSCSSGPEALDRCKTDIFDLVLVDMVMPRMNGLELIAKLKESTSEAKTMMMTGCGLTGREEGMPATVLSKPFDMTTLAKTVSKVLRELGDKNVNDSGAYSNSH